MEKLIIAAVKDVLKERIAIANDGMLAKYHASFTSRKILASNGVKITDNAITINGKQVAKIVRQYNSRKVGGCYRQLMPIIKEIC